MHNGPNTQPTQIASPTIFSLAKEVNEAARNILSRSGTIADCLGGSHPESSNGADPEPSDLHGVLQRVLTSLHETQEELYRSERVIGIATPAVTPDGACLAKARY